MQTTWPRLLVGGLFAGLIVMGGYVIGTRTGTFWGLAAGLWAGSGGWLWMDRSLRNSWRAIWRGFGFADLVWIGLRSLEPGPMPGDDAILQALILAILVCTVPWRSWGQAIYRASPSLWAVRRTALWSGAIAGGLILSYQILLGSDRWILLGVLSVSWGVTIAWLVALIVARLSRRAWTISGGVIPLSVASSMGASACVGAVCSTSASILAPPLIAAGLSGLLSTTLFPLLPLIVQGLLVLAGLGVAVSWTIHRGQSQYSVHGLRS